MAMWSVFGIISLLIALISILLPVALVVALQVWLCRRKTRWLGLILPGLSFLFSLLLVFSVGAFGLINQEGSVGTLTLEENGQVIQQTITENGMTTVYDGEGNILDQYPPLTPRRSRTGFLWRGSWPWAGYSWCATSQRWCWVASGSTTRTVGISRTRSRK